MTLAEAQAAFAFALERGYSASLHVGQYENLHPTQHARVELVNQRGMGFDWDLERLLGDFAETRWRVVWGGLRGQQSFYLEEAAS